jgi:hypothetical protein
MSRIWPFQFAARFLRNLLFGSGANAIKRILVNPVRMFHHSSQISYDATSIRRNISRAARLSLMK